MGHPIIYRITALIIFFVPVKQQITPIPVLFLKSGTLNPEKET